VESTRTKLRAARCPDCGEAVHLDGRLLIGEVFGCSHCGAQLEVANADPLELEPFSKVDAEEEDYV
jgi:lysine biosynthesis protein LysW